MMKKTFEPRNVMKLCTMTYWTTTVLVIFLLLSVTFSALSYYTEGPWYQIGYFIGGIVIVSLLGNALYLLTYLAYTQAEKKL